MLNNATYEAYVRILKNELVPALGCTEPIAIALAAAKARETLGAMPEKIVARCSGNIIKNAKGVIVPTTGNMKGIDTSAVLGAVAGDPSLGLEVLSKVDHVALEKTRELLTRGICATEILDTPAQLHIIVEMEGAGHTALAEIRDEHTNLIRLEKDGEVLFRKEEAARSEEDESDSDLKLLNLSDILTFADTVDMEDVRPMLERQVAYNLKIAREGMTHAYGGRVGSTLMRHYGENVRLRARAMAAAGSDARMGGCVLPVIINSGSGNQGITVSVPVIIYAQEHSVPREKLLRALVAANLISIHQKSYIGSLSAYCGVVSAACGAACGICYLLDYPYEVLCDTITNTIATVGGMVCDGAKSSCASKIATAVETALLGMKMGLHNRTFQPGEGLVNEDVEETISNIGRMGRVGMKSTDNEILNIMLGN